jgi:hypothetical protein
VELGESCARLRRSLDCGCARLNSPDNDIDQLIRDIDQPEDQLVEQQELRQEADRHGEELLDVMMDIASGLLAARESCTTTPLERSRGVSCSTDRVQAGRAVGAQSPSAS